MKYYAWLIFLLLITGCSQSRYSMNIDSAPIKLRPYHEPQPVAVRYEPYNVANFRPYRINGQFYTPLLTGKGHVEHGIASWYGQKFHGHSTANGEIFDMYELSAAHKTLPLPSFARITNLANQKTIIVRINDRGPFANDRILDLSFAAAKALDYLSTGTTPIRLEVLHVDEHNMLTIGQTPSIPLSEYLSPAPHKNSVNDTQATPVKNAFIQLVSLSDANKAQQICRGITGNWQDRCQVVTQDSTYKTLLGPFADEIEAKQALVEIRKMGFPEAFYRQN